MKVTSLNELIQDGRRLEGEWVLGQDHTLLYRTDSKDEVFRARGSLIAAEPEALVFSVTEKQTDQRIVTSIHKLTGIWRLDTKNRITFEAVRESGRRDVLTLKGSWKLNDAQQLLYSYSTETLKARRKTTREIVFDGSWDIVEGKRLVYSLGADTDSVFRFRGAFQTPNVLAKAGEIRYQAGVEVLGRRKTRSITLFGRWSLSRDLAVTFDMECGGKNRSIEFGAEYRLIGKNRVTARLKTADGRRTGFELVLTRAAFGRDGVFFARLARTLEDSRAEAGLSLRW